MRFTFTWRWRKITAPSEVNQTTAPPLPQSNEKQAAKLPTTTAPSEVVSPPLPSPPNSSEEKQVAKPATQKEPVVKKPVQDRALQLLIERWAEEFEVVNDPLTNEQIDQAEQAYLKKVSLSLSHTHKVNWQCDNTVLLVTCRSSKRRKVPSSCQSHWDNSIAIAMVAAAMNRGIVVSNSFH